MSYHIYNTKGLVLSQRPVGEADRIYSILTRDLGLVRARALAVRSSTSKLRGALEPFSLSSVSLVRGKEYWRLTSAELIQNICATPSVAQPLALLETLVQGESAHTELFDAVENAICATPSVAQGEGVFEIGLVAQILFHLGYLKESDLGLEEKDLVKAINQGLESSHLV